MTTRVEVLTHDKLSEKLHSQKDDIINCFNRLKPVSSDFCDGYLAQISSLDKMFESESQRAIDALDIIGEEERHDKDCVVKFEGNLDLWRKQSLKTREEIQKHEELSKDLLEAKNDLIIAFDRLKVNAPEFTAEHERVLSIDQTLEEDSKRVEDALNAIKQAEQAEEEQRQKAEVERKATQERLRLAMESAARADKESAKPKKDSQKMDPVHETRQPEENQLEKGLVKQEPEHKIIEISMQSKPRCSISAIYIFDHTISIAKVGQQLEDYKDSQIQELLDNYGLDIKEYSEQHPKKVTYLQRIVDMRDKYQQTHPDVTTDKKEREETSGYQEQNTPKQSAERRKIENVWWGASFRKDRPRVLFVQWANRTQSASYHADDFDRLFKDHCEDIKEYYEKFDSDKKLSGSFDRFCQNMKHEIEIWKGPQPQNDLSISQKDRGSGRGGGR